MTTTPGGGRAAVVGAVASEPRLGSSFSSTSQAGATADFWSLLVNARTSEQLCQAWLGILCQWIPGTQAGLLLLHELQLGDGRHAAQQHEPAEKNRAHHPPFLAGRRGKENCPGQKSAILKPLDVPAAKD